VVETAPRLADGTPFPTLYYLTCPRAVAAMSRLEAAGVMREMQEQLAAHRDYLTRRDEVARAAGVAPLPPGTQSAGGMPSRVKCLHALAAHELAVPGANPLGRQALAAAGRWWAAGPCVSPGAARESAVETAVKPHGGRPRAAGETGGDATQGGRAGAPEAR